jgi:anti-sigma factor RsiW
MSNPDKCGEYVELLDAYHDGELSTGQKTLVEKHLSLCTSCGQKLAEIERLVQALQSLPRAKPARDFSVGMSLPEVADETPRTDACSEIAELLDAYHDGELDRQAITQLEDHLNACAGCRQELLKLACLVEGIKALPRLAPERDLVGSIDLDSLAARQKLPVSATIRSKSRWAASAAWTLGAGAVAAAVLALVFANNYKFMFQSPAETVAGRQANPELASPVAPGGNADRRGQQPEKPLIAEQQPATQIKVTETAKPPVSPAPAGNKEAYSRTLVAVVKSVGTSGKKQHVQEFNRKSAGLAPGAADDPVAEVAAIPDAVLASGADALGIGTDEDGLYDIKI